MSAPERLPQQDFLLKILRYDPDSGKLFWRDRPRDMFPDIRSCAAWNARYSEREAFTSVTWNGYLRGAILNASFHAHRVIWAMQTGSWPDADVDHINGVRADNRWCNLREATRSQNNCNKSGSPNSRTGVKGVRPSGARFCATIKINKQLVWLGAFATVDEARDAYAKASAELHGEFGRTA